MTEKIVIDTSSLRELGTALKTQAGKWASHQASLDIATRHLGRSWQDEQFFEFQQELKRLGDTMAEFTELAETWSTRLADKADRQEQAWSVRPAR